MGMNIDFTSDRNVINRQFQRIYADGLPDTGPGFRSAAAPARTPPAKQFDKIAFPDDPMVAVFQRFDPVLLVPAAHRQPTDDLVCAGQGGPGISLARTVWPLVNLCEIYLNLPRCL